MYKIYFHTLGCKLNFTETEFFKEVAKESEYITTEKPEEADIIVVNTCTVTSSADKKSLYTIKHFRKINPTAKIYVTGCLATTNKEKLKNSNKIDFIFDNFEKKFFRNIITKTPYVSDKNDFLFSFSSNSRTRAFIKVQDGCDYFCTYCKVPFARGRSRNAPIDKVIQTINQLYEKGFNEVILTGINLGDFGKSTNENFYKLLLSIENYTKIPRVRLSSIEPDLLTNDIIDLVLNSEKFLPHFHIPLQSASDEILSLMKRRYTAKDFYNIINYIAKKNNLTGIGIDVIVGFPGETDKHFKQTFNFLFNLDFSYLHVFKYSDRENTPASKFANKVDEQVKKERSIILHKLSASKHKDFIKKNIGKYHKVLVEHKMIENQHKGYTENYIEVLLNPELYKPNDIVSIVLTENIVNLRPKFSQYDL